MANLQKLFLHSMPQTTRYHLIISPDPNMMRKNLQHVGEKCVAPRLISKIFEESAEFDKILASQKT